MGLFKQDVRNINSDSWINLNYFKMITVVMPSFFSAKLVKERIQEIGNDTPVIIIENSKDENLKEELEKKHNNVSVIIPG